MASFVFSTVLGSMFGPIGGMLGGMLGSWIDSKLFAKHTTIEQQGPRLSDMKISTSAYGETIPLVYGTVRTAGNLIWSTDLVEHEERHENSTGGGGKGGGGGSSGTTVVTIEYWYSASFAVAACFGPIAGFNKIWFDNKIVYNVSPDADSDTRSRSLEFASKYLTFYLGTANQGANATMQAVNGASTTPNYRNIAYVMFQDVDLRTWGNRLPTINVEVVQNGHMDGGVLYPDDVSLASIITDITIRSGLSTSDIETTELSDYVTGFTIGADSYKNGIVSLSKAFMFTCRNTNGKLAFIPWKRPSVSLAIPESDLGYDSGEAAEQIRGTIKPETTLPRSIQLEYIDSSRDDQVGVQRSRRHFGKAKSDIVLRVPVVLSAQQAARAADNALYSLWMDRTTFKFSLPPKYLLAEPGDVATVAARGFTHTLQFIQIEIGANLGIRAVAKTYASSVFGSQRSGTAGEYDNSLTQMPLPGSTTAVCLNLPAQNESQDNLGFFVGASGENESWKGCTVYQSLDSGATYTPLDTIPMYSIIGECDTILPDASTTTRWDTTSTVDVTLVKGELTSISDEEVLLGGNLISIGGELIQFAIATLIGSKKYRLSRLLRGRRGTEAGASGHAAYERFALISSLKYVSIAANRLNMSHSLKFVPSGVNIDTEVAIPFVPTGETKRPFSPCWGLAVRDSGNVNISWVRRDRLGQELPSDVDLRFSESFERWIVNIYDAAGTTVVRTYTVDNDFQALGQATRLKQYPSSDIAVDYPGGLPAVGGLKIEVCQWSALVGNGVPLKIMG